MNTYGRSRKLLIAVVIIMGILILAFDSTGKHVDDTFSPIGDITNIQIENGSVDFKIVEGDSFFVKGENLEEDSYTFIQEGDDLIIKTDKRNIEFFHFGLFEEPSRITVTIPSNIQFNSISINNGSGNFIVDTNLITRQCSITVGSGEIDAAAIQVESLEGSVGSGDFTFKSLEARDCNLELGSGDIEGKNMQVMNMSALTGSGDIYLKGVLTGVSEFICGSGDIELILDGDMEEYSFEVDGDDIEINGENYGKKYKSDTVMDKQLHLQANSGDIDVTIR